VPVIKYESVGKKAESESGLEVRSLVDAHEGSESLRMGEITIAPHSRIARHVHSNTEEAIVILEGTLDVLLGRQRMSLGPGNAVLAPAGSVHGFLNRQEEPARILFIFPTHHVEKVLASAPRSTVGFASEKGLTGHQSPGARPLDRKD